MRLPGWSLSSFSKFENKIRRILGRWLSSENTRKPLSQILKLSVKPWDMCNHNEKRETMVCQCWWEFMKDGSRIKNQPITGSFESQVSIFSNSDDYLGLYTQESVLFLCWKFDYSLTESAFSQPKRPLSLTWSYLLLLWTKGLRRSWAAGWHLPSHLDLELLLQGIFYPLLNLNALRCQELCCPVWWPLATCAYPNSNWS